jgi:hypothetical protein
MLVIGGTLLAMAPGALGQVFGLRELSEETINCVQCHRQENPVIYEQWGSSKHFRGNIGCYECHAAEEEDVDGFDHYGSRIAIIVSPKDCARCHAREVEEFLGSRHSHAGKIIGSLDNVLAEVVEGNSAFVTPGFPNGNSAAAVNGCWQCHGSEVKVLEGGKLDPATYPNSGIGRINPDGTQGSCNACHTRHEFSAAQARFPDTCGKCHMGPDHPQWEIYNESKHGILFRANVDKMALDNEKWILGEDYNAAPTCATCHMSATNTTPVTHDIGRRISWNNRPAVSIRTDAADMRMGLEGQNLPWQVRRDNMKTVCLNCHNTQWVDNFYVQYDALVELYNEKFGKPGLELYELAKPLLNPVSFSNKLDFVWYEIWHHEGRRARHGASMMGPDYTHWHGTYEVAKHFYSEMVPELRDLIERGRASGDPERALAADALEAKLDEVLAGPNHQWYLGEMDPEEAARRQRAREEFEERYEKK